MSGRGLHTDPVRRRLAYALCTVLVGFTAGCGSGTEEEITVPDWLADSPEGGPPEAAAAVVDSAPPFDVAVEQPPPAADEPASPYYGEAEAPTPDFASVLPQQSDMPLNPSGPTDGPFKLSLKVNPGDRVPMRKVVETVLTQNRVDGTADAHRTRTEIDLTLIAEDVQPLQTQWAVRYGRVRVVRNMGGKEMVFEAAPGVLQATDDVEARAYQAMTQHGFSFAVDGTNRVSRLSGFEAFVTACLGGVSPAVGTTAGAVPQAAVAEFVDASVGVLPFRTPLTVGQRMTVDGSVAAPLLMEWKEVVTIDALEPQTVRLTGSANVAPSQTPGSPVEVLGGVIRSEAVVYRDSGLPQSARRTETIQMLAKLSTGEAVPQTKTTVTTIEAFPRPTP